MTHTDFLGKALSLGDEIVFVEPTYRGLKTGKIVAFTEKRVRVEYLNTNTSYDPSKHFVDVYLCDPKNIYQRG